MIDDLISRVASAEASARKARELVTFGTVTDESPFAVRLDGDTASVPAVACTAADVGDRVVLLHVNRQLLAIGAVGGCPHAVGDLYTTTSTVAPGDRWSNTTWEAYGAGRVLVGYDAAQTEFDAIGETGGAKTHQLSAAEMPSHAHLLGSTGTAGTDSASVLRSTGVTPKDQVVTQSAGSGQAHNNLQPYVVVYIWRRTA